MQDAVKYESVIASAQIGRHDGLYELRITDDRDDDQKDKKAPLHTSSVRVQINERQAGVLDASRWPSELRVQVDEPIELVLTLDKPVASIRPGDNLILTKDGHVTKDLLTISSIDAGKCQVTIKVPQASLADSATYKLLWAESPLAETRVLVRQRALELLDELSADKSEYVEDEPVRFSFALSRPLDSAALEKHVVLLRNGSPCGDLKWTQLQDKVRFYLFEFNYS